MSENKSKKDHDYYDGCIDKCGSCNLCCLAVCKDCGLYEGALTTHCFNKHVTYDQSELIYKGVLNFRGGIWIEGECSEHSPVFYHKHKDEWNKQHNLDLE